MDKKGSARDILFIAIIIFGLAIGFSVINYMMGETVSRMIEIPAINESSSAVEALQGINTVTARLDYVIFGVFLALVLGLIITSWFIGGNPIFMFVYFIVVVITVVISTVLANTWEMISQGAIAATVFGNVTINAFPLTNNLMLYLPIYISVIGFIGIVIMFAKPAIQNEQ